ncbi:pentapeptide repeat-containing protein [Nostoc sp. FACHB-152]|uniref:pentapeptide repeat-containing protein n=1 Tax=unclassified Nostoc TaxID=2593658 RepID=UPI0016869A86|nr:MULTISPECIES: pentapeptide repeat-containing protein [unclassified Nostoc]MBD2451181.1 pentapeptide repeat-containing protein [Nostoc sp. FACHB-152]MBD2470031.1 pentapeptide repeat-containing protein [Nostoc sp. FACHB-145]
MTLKTMIWEELLQRYADGERDFRKIHLVFDEYERDESKEARFDKSGDPIMRPGVKEGCLRGTNLSGVDFRGSNLRAIRMYCQGLILCHANLSKLDLNYFLFMGSNLSGANLSGANIFHADFLRANLSGAKLDRVIASDASFTSANLTSASFIKATLTNTHFGGVDLTNVNFRNARNAYFPEAILKDTIMPDGSLRSS